MVRRRFAQVAELLNDLRACGISVSAAHGAVISDYGFILPGADGWQVRMKITDPEMAPRGDPDDD